jgi:hypothetical protein
MVIETFKPESADMVCARYGARGRMLPTGLIYLDSWVTNDGKKCFQLMETDNAAAFDEWIGNWNDLVDFEIVPVHDSPTKTNQSVAQERGKSRE